MKKRVHFYYCFTIIGIFLLFISLPLFAGGQKEAKAEEPTLVWVHHYLGGINPEGDKAWIEDLYRQTGIRVKIIKPTEAEYQAKVASMLTAGEQIDLLYVDPDQFATLTRDNPGLFEPLDERIKNSPILSDKKKFPDSAWDTIRQADGHIYGTQPAVGLAAGGTLPIVRWDWVEKLGFADKFEGNRNLTLEDYYKLLYSFTYNDPDGNGKNDTYGIALGYTTYEMNPFFGTLGMLRQYAKDDNGKIYCPISQDKAKPVWEYFARLYKEKILEPNFVTNKSSTFRELFMTDKVGMICYWDNWVPRLNDIVKSENPDSSFRARAIYPPVGPDGTSRLRHGGGPYTAILSNSKYKDEAFKLLEFFSTDAGALLGTAGVKGYDYNIVDGKIVFTEVGMKAGQNHGMKPAWNWKIPWEISPEWREAMEILANAPGDVQRYYGRNGDQWEELVGIDSAKIIRGKVSVEEGLKSMRKRLKDQGLVDY